MKGNGDCEIENGKGATRKQGTECAVLLLQAFGNHQQCGAGQETKYGTQCFVNPVFINGIFYKEADSDDEYKNTNLTEKIFTDKLFIVNLLPFGNRRYFERSLWRSFLQSGLSRFFFKGSV